MCVFRFGLGMRAGGPLIDTWSQKNKENFPSNNSLFFHQQVLMDFAFGIISMFVDTSQKQRTVLLLHEIKPKISGFFSFFSFFPPHFIF